MAEGGFDEYEMEDIRIDEMDRHNDYQLTNDFNEIKEKIDLLYEKYGNNENTPEDVRVKYKKYKNALNAIEEERVSLGNAVSAFIDDDNGIYSRTSWIDDMNSSGVINERLTKVEMEQSEVFKIFSGCD